jgi:hypothetical protein
MQDQKLSERETREKRRVLYYIPDHTRAFFPFPFPSPSFAIDFILSRAVSTVGGMGWVTGAENSDKEVRFLICKHTEKGYGYCFVCHPQGGFPFLFYFFSRHMREKVFNKEEEHGNGKGNPLFFACAAAPYFTRILSFFFPCRKRQSIRMQDTLERNDRD